MDISSNTVVVTGFGSFRQYLVNSSWEAAKELLKLGLGDDVDIHILELPVAYRKVEELVCKAWVNLNPKLMIHLGLAPFSKRTIILEQCGKNKGYKEKDACGFCPNDGCCIPEGPEKIESIINMKTIWKNLQIKKMDVIFSRDAGSCVDDYIGAAVFSMFCVHEGTERNTSFGPRSFTCAVNPCIHPVLETETNCGRGGHHYLDASPMNVKGYKRLEAEAWISKNTL